MNSLVIEQQRTQTEEKQIKGQNCWKSQNQSLNLENPQRTAAQIEAVTIPPLIM